MAASNFSLGLNFLVYKVGFLMGSASVGIVSMLSVFLSTVSYYYCPGGISPLPLAGVWDVHPAYWGPVRM